MLRLAPLCTETLPARISDFFTLGAPPPSVQSRRQRLPVEAPTAASRGANGCQWRRVEAVGALLPTPWPCALNPVMMPRLFRGSAGKPTTVRVLFPPPPPPPPLPPQAASPSSSSTPKPFGNKDSHKDSQLLVTNERAGDGASVERAGVGIKFKHRKVTRPTSKS